MLAGTETVDERHQETVDEAEARLEAMEGRREQQRDDDQEACVSDVAVVVTDVCSDSGSLA